MSCEDKGRNWCALCTSLWTVQSSSILLEAKRRKDNLWYPVTAAIWKYYKHVCEWQLALKELFGYDREIDLMDNKGQ